MSWCKILSRKEGKDINDALVESDLGDYFG